MKKRHFVSQWVFQLFEHPVPWHMTRFCGRHVSRRREQPPLNTPRLNKSPLTTLATCLKAESRNTIKRFFLAFIKNTWYKHSKYIYSAFPPSQKKACVYNDCYETSKWEHRYMQWKKEIQCRFCDNDAMERIRRNDCTIPDDSDS